MSMKNLIHVRGYESFYAGYKLKDCPYKRGTYEEREWKIGWHKADKHESRIKLCITACIIGFLVSSTLLVILFQKFYVINRRPARPIQNIIAKTNIVNTNDIILQELKLKAQRIIAFTIYYEGEGESLRGKRAIGTVIWNSNKAKTYQGFIDACFDFNRFSCWNDKNPPALNFTNDYNFTVSYLIAEKIVNKQFERDGVWNQYFAHKKIKPYWYKYLTYVTVIGNHTFGYLENYSD